MTSADWRRESVSSAGCARKYWIRVASVTAITPFRLASPNRSQATCADGVSSGGCAASSAVAVRALTATTSGSTGATPSSIGIVPGSTGITPSSSAVSRFAVISYPSSKANVSGGFVQPRSPSNSSSSLSAASSFERSGRSTVPSRVIKIR